MPPQKRTPIDIWRKQEVIRWIDNEGGGVPTRAVKHFRALGWSVDGGAVRKWWRARGEILAADPKTRRLPGAGRKKATAAPAAAVGALPSANSSGASTAGSVDHELESRAVAVAAAAAATASGDGAGSATTAATTAAAAAGGAAAAAGGFQLPLAVDADEGGGDESPRPAESEVATTEEPPAASIAQLTPSERAVQLLQRRYSSKLPAEDVVEAFDVMLDPMKARIFLVMTPGEQRDLWLLRQIASRRDRPAGAQSSASTVV